jgi:hypothetical protein
MGESKDNLDKVGGTFDLDGLKRKYRQQEVASRPRHPLAAIEREILEEIACQSGRYGERLDALLEQLATLRQRIEQASARRRSPEAGTAGVWPDLATAMAQYNQLRAQAQQVQHYLIIHREAMGFWHHDEVFRRYPIPRALTPLLPGHTPGPAQQP